jgi:dihydropteroate synthase
MKPTFYIRNYRFADGLSLNLGSRTLIMGILNVTPDSFSDGGKFSSVEKAVEHAKRMEAEGADIIDIGGESTRPGFDPVPLEEELKRVIPVIRAVRKEVNIPISVDTYKAETARQALEAGAHIINDIWGFRRDPQIAHVAAAYGCPVVLMHNREVENRETSNYSDFLPEMLSDLRSTIALAKSAGVKDENIWLDPGIGFAKNYEEHLELMGHLDQVVSLGYPVLLGTSRKSFIRRTLDVAVDDTLEGTAATQVLGIVQGCQILRVHDVKQMKRVAQMTDAIVYRQAERV